MRDMTIIAQTAGWRVRPYDSLQWVLERRRSQLKGGGERWDVVAYCRTRDGLLFAVTRYKADIAPGELAHLPPFFEESPEPELAEAAE
jgi:hypothetical protein